MHAACHGPNNLVQLCWKGKHSGEQREMRLITSKQQGNRISDAHCEFTRRFHRRPLISSSSACCMKGAVKFSRSATFQSESQFGSFVPRAHIESIALRSSYSHDAPILARDSTCHLEAVPKWEDARGTPPFCTGAADPLFEFSDRCSPHSSALSLTGATVLARSRKLLVGSAAKRQAGIWFLASSPKRFKVFVNLADYCSWRVVGHA